jgi:hypothetical protein
MQRIRSDAKAALFLLLLLCGGAATHAQSLKPPTHATRLSGMKSVPYPTFPGLSGLPASATSVTVEWYDRSTDAQKFVVYRRDSNGVWQSVHEVPANTAGTGNNSYSWVDTDLSLSGQCYMIAAVNAAGAAGKTAEECTVRPDPSRFPQTVPRADKQWFGLSLTNDGTGDLRSQPKGRSLKWDTERFGVDLVWDEHPALWKIEAQGGPHVMQGQAVALRVWGGGWLAYGNETWGVDLVLSSTPVYQWYVLTDTPGRPIEPSGAFALWNSAANGYLISRAQTWGVDLDWDKPAGSTPSLQIASVWMTAQPPVQGFVPFLGYFGGGPGNTSVLTQVSDSGYGVTLFFIKPGHQSSECGDSSAVITLAPGATMTIAQMQTIWGSATPSLSQRLPFLACAATQASNVTVNVQYRNQ